MNGQTTTANIIVGSGTSLYKFGSNATIGSLSIVGNGNNENRGAIRMEGGTFTVTNGITLQGSTTFGTSGGTLTGTIRGTATNGNTLTLTLGTSNTNGGATFSSIVSDGVNGGKLALNIGAVNMGDISLQGVNTYSGGTMINFGRVSIGANGSALGSGTVTINGDGIVGDGQVYAGAATLANNFIISGFGGNTGDATQRGAIRLDGGTVNGTITLAGNAAIGANSGTGTINGRISGDFFLRKVDAGTISLTNATNAYTGGTQVNGGTLSFSNGSLGTIGNVSIAGATLRWNPGNTQDISGRLVRTGGTVTYDTNGNDVTFASGIGTGTSMVIKNGAGTLTLTGYNSSTGGIEILGGVLSVSNIADTGTTSQIGNLTSNHIAAKNGSTLRYTGLLNASTARNLWVDTVGGTIEVTNAATTLSFTGTGGNINKVLTKTGAGTLTVADDINSGDGGVTINAGTLNLTNANNSYTAATSINGGTLVFGGAAGAGTGNSATTIGSGGTLRLDNSTASIADRFGAGAIAMNGGNIKYLHSGTAATSYSETLGALAIANGVNTVATSQAASGQTSKLTFDSLSRINGSINFVGNGLGSVIDPTNEINFANPPVITGGVIGPWATVNGSDLATVIGGSLVSYTGYTDIDALGSTIADGATTNFRIFGNGISGNIALGSILTTVNSLTMSNGTNAATVDTLGCTLTTSGILLASGAQALTVGVAADHGTLQVNSDGGTIILNNQSLANPLTINAAIADNTSASGVTKVGPGLVTLAGTNSYTGVTTIAEGVLAVSTLANGGINSGIGAATNAQGNLVLNNGTLRYTGNSVSSDRGFTIAAGTAGTIDVSTTGQTLTISGGVAATTGSLVKTGSGILLLNGQSQHTGPTVVNGGMLAVDGSQVFNRLTNNNQVVINNGGTFEIRGVNAVPSSANGVDVTVNSGGVFSVVTGGSTAIGVNGTSHAHIRNLTLSGGTVNFSYSGAGSAYSGESVQLNGSLTVSGNAASTIQSSGNTTTTGLALIGTNIFTVNDVTGNSNVDLTISAELEDNDSAGDGLLKNGTGTLTLSGANSYTGATTVSAGRLISGNTSSTSSSIISSGAVLELNHGSGTRSYGVNTSFSGTGTIEKTGAGNVNYSGSATFQMGSGALIHVRQGTFTAANGANEKWRTGAGTLLSPYVYNLSDLNVESGAIFDGVEATATGDGGIFVDELRGTGTIQVGYLGGYSNTLTFGIDNGTASFGGTLGGNSFGNYVKTGTGTQTLTATSNSTGTMTVNGGRLNVNGTIASATTNVGTNGTAGILGGDGQINGAVALGAVGTLLPGQGGVTDRTLTINGNVTTTAGSVISFTVDAMNNHDKLVISAGKNIGLSGADLEVNFDDALTFDILGAGQGDDFLAALDSFAGTGSWFKLISGTTTGMFDNVTDTLTSGELAYFGLTGPHYKTTIEGQSFWVAQGSTYLVAIPEPRAALLGGLGILMLFRRRR